MKSHNFPLPLIWNQLYQYREQQMDPGDLVDSHDFNLDPETTLKSMLHFQIGCP